MVMWRRVRGGALAILFVVAGACTTSSGGSDAGSGLPSSGGIFPWRVTLADSPPPLVAEPGGTWSLSFDLEVDLRPHIPSMGRFERILAVVYGELRYDDHGRYHANESDGVLSSRFTTTGIPIASRDLWPSLRLVHGKEGSPFEGLVAFELPPGEQLAGVHHLRGRFEVALPQDIPRGWWHPRLTLLVKVEGVEAPVFLDMFYKERQEPAPKGFPLVQVGRSEPPRMPWTAFPDPRIWGRAGSLPEELDGDVGLLPIAGFPTELILPPGRYPIGPGLPTLSPQTSLPEIYNYDSILPRYQDPELVASVEISSCSIEDPDGRQSQCLTGQGFPRPDVPVEVSWKGETPGADLSRTGTYRLRLVGAVTDRFGRKFEGGGTYVVHSALPLTFSTSCKPGTSFLVGNAYPPKVNVNPAVPATVEVRVEFYPQSDPARKRVWQARGVANRFGHYVARRPPFVFDEPGEYLSLVRATYRDRQGRSWMGLQSSTGVVAPEQSDVRLRPAGRVAEGVLLTGGARGTRYADRLHPGPGLLVQSGSVVNAVRTPGLPHDPSDTLFVSVQANSLDVDLQFSVDVLDPDLAGRLLDAGTLDAAVLPRKYQRAGSPWTYLQDVWLRGTSSQHGLVWTRSIPGRRTDLPIRSVARGPLDSFAFPSDNSVDAWVSFGAVRPGFPALTGATQRSGGARSWALRPNSFGAHINSSKNGDLPGDIYRVQAGLVLKDYETGRNHYDLYGASVVVTGGSLASSAVLPPGERPLVSGGGVDQYVFLATDTHDALEVGERLGFGGMVFPNVPAEVTWTVETPSGEGVVVRGKADRRGIVRGSRVIPVEGPGVYEVRAQVRYQDLEGGIPGAPDGSYWVCAVPPDGPTLLQTDLPPFRRVGAAETVRIPLRWPSHLRDVKVRYGVIMPGRVIEQGEASVAGAAWSYGFTPAEAVIRAPNFDVRFYANGRWELADTVVFQFCLEGKDGQREVADSLRLVLRGDMLMNPRGL